MRRIFRALLFAPLLLLFLPLETNSATEANALKLLISVEQHTVTAPFPLRVTLHLHNSGQRPLWLYRKARDASSTHWRRMDSHLIANQAVIANTSTQITDASQFPSIIPRIHFH